MYLVLHLDQNDYQFITTLHPTLEGAAARFENLLWEFVLEAPAITGESGLVPGVLPPKNKWHDLFNAHTGEGVHIYQIGCDGKPAEEIFPFSEDVRSLKLVVGAGR